MAADKRLIAARGPLWHKSDRRKNRIPKGLRGIDRDSEWGCSKHDGWVQGYSFEVVVSATKSSPAFPLWASTDMASAKETTTFDEKIDDLPESTKSVAADSGYDSNHIAERFKSFCLNGKIACGIVAWKTIKLNCWPLCSPAAYWSATTIVVETRTVKSVGSSTPYEFPDTLSYLLRQDRTPCTECRHNN